MDVIVFIIGGAIGVGAVIWFIKRKKAAATTTTTKPSA